MDTPGFPGGDGGSGGKGGDGGNGGRAGDGGDGGGAFRLIVTGTLTIGGELIARGETGGDSEPPQAGAAGDLGEDGVGAFAGNGGDGTKGGDGGNKAEARTPVVGVGLIAITSSKTIALIDASAAVEATVSGDITTSGNILVDVDSTNEAIVETTIVAGGLGAGT